MSQRISIITGASRGLGAAMAQQRAVAGWRVLGISRQVNAELAALSGAHVEQWAADLCEPLPVAQRLSAWIGNLDASSVSCIELINNAALMNDPADLYAAKPEQLGPVLRVGLEAPLLLTQAFLHATASWPMHTGTHAAGRGKEHTHARRLVLHISSGNGRRALAGSATYSALKAGLDHMARVVAVEEAQRPHGARIVSLAPGIIDTDMQVQLRNADVTHFAAQPMFEAWHTNGDLSSCADAAARVLAYLERPDFGSNPVADVREA
jgi:benzil reductase ((S)-benzoin forming)